MSEGEIIVVNFAHPLTAAQLAQIAALSGQCVGSVRGSLAEIDPQQAFEPQATELVDRVGLSPVEWQTLPLLINPPGLATLAAVLLAELHGRMGHFPTLIRVRPAGGTMMPTYEVGELINLEVVRARARQRRSAPQDADFPGVSNDP